MAVRMIRSALPLCALALLAAAPLSAREPLLRCLSDFEPGRYLVRSTGDVPASRCLASAAELAMAGRSGGPDCRVTVARDTRQSGTLTWTCPDGRSGRSEIRRDASGIYTVSAQGVEDGLPWISRAEWRRTGPCEGR